LIITRSVYAIWAVQNKCKHAFSVVIDLRPIHTERVYVCLRSSTRVYADMEHMLKGLRVYTKRVYLRRPA